MSLKRPTRKRARISATLIRCQKSPTALLTGRGAERCDFRSPLGGFPIWPCSRWGLPCRSCCQDCGALLPHRFTLTGYRDLHRGSLGGLLSVALSVGSRPPGVTWHLIRRSPDFPPSWKGHRSGQPDSDHLADSVCIVHLAETACGGLFGRFAVAVAGITAAGTHAAGGEGIGFVAGRACQLCGNGRGAAGRQLFHQQIDGAT